MIRLLFPLLLAACCLIVSAHAGHAALPRIEARFDLPGLAGNPFDYTQNDVQVTIQRPDGKTATVPAFFDGGTSSATWRVRYAPPRAGTYTIAKITRNGAVVQPSSLEPKAFTVAGQAGTGFIRVDPKDKTRFAFENGAPYYPIGHNVAWKGGNGSDVDVIFGAMGKAGENWSRVWMNHWDDKNLDWNKPGTMDLTVARRWDKIVDAAEKNGIHFQMTLQHHGPYSSTVNSNWGENPWNAKNPGGFLDNPEQFFTDARARAWTKMKYRYVIARWGYSSAILAWELFNEVEWVDAVKNKHEATVAAWHKEMADFLRAQDPFRHLITTSSDRRIAGLYDAVDFVQPHAYPVDAVASALGLSGGAPKDKPIFFGEIGPSSGLDTDDGTFLHAALWASLMSESAGAAQYWAWETVERNNLYPFFRSATDFVQLLGPKGLAGMRPVAAVAETAEQGAVSFGPGGGWNAAKQTEFAVGRDGSVEGIGGLPSFFQGEAHRDMFAGVTFRVDYAQPGTCAIAIRQIAKAGAKIVVKVDGAVVAEQAFPATASDARVDATVSAAVPAGKHAVRIESTGADWFVVERITFAPYGSTLRALGKADSDRAVLWTFRSQKKEGTAAGTVVIPGLKAGRYRVIWWDTRAGKTRSTESATVAPSKPLMLQTPPIAQDLAAFITRW